MKEKISVSHKNQNKSAFMLVIGGGLILIALAALLAFPSAQNFVQTEETSAMPVSVNFPAPEVQLTNLDGQSVALSDYKGKVILYNAWATWCPPCQQEMPTLESYYQSHIADGLVVVAIEDGEPEQDVRTFVQQHNLSFPVWPDVKYVATTAFRIENLPTSFVIDRKGTVRLTWTGAISKTMLERYVTPLLKE